MKKINYVMLIFPLVIVLTSISVVVANQFYSVANSPVTINKFGECRVAQGSNGNTYFVPTNTATEWTAFRNNKPSSVSLTSCPGTCTYSASTGNTVPSGRSSPVSVGTYYNVDLIPDASGNQFYNASCYFCAGNNNSVYQSCNSGGIIANPPSSGVCCGMN